MKRDKSTRKLSLKRETLRNLQADELSQVAGGARDRLPRSEIVCSASGVCICGDDETVVLGK